jgi:hypothetical protein
MEKMKHDLDKEPELAAEVIRLLERVQRLESVAEAAKAIGDELGDCLCGNAWCTKARVLKQALNALEGGAGDARD